MVYLVHCILAFWITNADGVREKRVYQALGVTEHMNEQLIGVDFSIWQKKHKVDMPWTTHKININSCNVIRKYGSIESIPKEQF